MNETNSEISIQVISDIKGINQMENEWNQLVQHSCKNPFMLSGFVIEYIKSHSKEWTPKILVIYKKDTLIGIAPFMIRKKFGFVMGTVSNPLWCFDFIINDEFKEVCISHIIDFLFKKLKCKFVDFTLSCDSSNYKHIINQCDLNKIQVKKFPAIGRRIIPINITWSEYTKKLGTKFRSKIRRNEKKLDEIGSWKLFCDLGKDFSENVEKILEVEKNSWKAEMRKKEGQSTDNDIMVVLKASKKMQNEPKFKCKIWYITIGQKIITYCLVIEYLNCGYLVKTSYDEQYKKAYPGFFLQNAVVQNLFNTDGIEQIDFLSNLSYLKAWAKECVPRVRMILFKGRTSTIIHSLFENNLIKKIFS